MKILVGSTGFVGSNLSSQTGFDGLFNSKNIQEAFGLSPDILIYSGVRAEKFIANKEPELDFSIIENAIENIKKINPKKVILISTVDVYPSTMNVDENTVIDQEMVQPYGKNRLFLERWIEENFDDYLILRLPGLFGEKIKKNFIYDIINIIPAMLNEELFQKYSHNDWIVSNYTKQDNGFYKLNSISENEREILKKQFLSIGFSALNFTDSRGVFQFYNLKNLWNDIERATASNIKKLNLATEPVGVNEIYKAVFDKNFENELGAVFPHYDLHTIHSGTFGNGKKHIQDKETVLQEIIEFIKSKK
ncbi:MAG: NAD(P)-dependent oxidoreductase [Flavobacterium sp.]|uniref:NAD(P)-dependent oxidoreductase n=1 Tax=Flavobacterium sp. TaxID=239 RepID=UPI00326794B9